ncbi:MAG: hypothetical protein Q4E87_07835, partial [bacterium]|nr:hypothetical protein [bacterium]
LIAALNVFLPILPNPLIATLTMFNSPLNLLGFRVSYTLNIIYNQVANPKIMIILLHKFLIFLYGRILWKIGYN